MSKCISSEGEYSDHELSEQQRFMCARCFVFDEDSALARVRELEATVERVRALVRLTYPDDMTPAAKRQFDAALEAIGGDDE